LCRTRYTVFAEYVRDVVAVWAAEVAHVLDQPEDLGQGRRLSGVRDGS
jgi:hypothetical protein